MRWGHLPDAEGGELAELTRPVVVGVAAQGGFETLDGKGFCRFVNNALVTRQMLVANGDEAKGLVPPHPCEGYGNLCVVKFFTTEVHNLIRTPEPTQRGGAPEVAIDPNEVAQAITKQAGVIGKDGTVGGVTL